MGENGGGCDWKTAFLSLHSLWLAAAHSLYALLPPGCSTDCGDSVTGRAGEDGP